MKKLSKLLALAAGFATLFFASCADGNISGTAANQANDKTKNAKEYEISLFAEDGTALDLSKWGVAAEKAGERTIVSEGLGADIEDPAKVKFYLWGTNQLNTSDASITNPTEVVFKLDDSAVSTTVGKVTLGLSASRWNLTLAAVDATKITGAAPTVTDITGAAYYIGYANVDLRSATSIKFYLSAEGLTGPGSVQLKFSFDGMDGATGADKGTWSKEHAALLIDKGYTITADITSRLKNITSSPQTIDTSKFLPTPAAAPAAPFTGSETASDAAGDTKTWASVAPGTYNLEVTFTCPSSGVDVAHTYVWSDILIVLPNQAIDADVLVPDVVLYKPDAPATFKIGYEEASLNKLSNTYNGVLAWADSSNNEKYFEIQYADLEGTSNLLSAIVDDDTKWNGATTSLDAAQKVKLQTDTEDFYGNTKLGWVAGSLVKNNKEAVVKLSLGRRYLFRIAAVNDAGHSEWTYATYDLDTPTQTISTGLSTKSFTPKAYSIYKIDATSNDYDVDGSNVAICANLYRLTYHLNGGTYKFDASTSKATDLVYYLSQKPEPATLTDDGANPPVITDGIPVFTPIGDPDATPAATFPTLYKGTNSWTSWRREIVEGDVYQNAAVDRPGYSAGTAALTSVALTAKTLSCYKPDGYLGYRNLDLFASYTLSSADVEVYNDADYEFLPTEIALTGATSGSGHAYEFAYTATTSATAFTLNYAKGTHPVTFAYDSMVVSIRNVATGEIKAVGTVNPTSNSYAFDIKAFGEGKFYITVVGEYKGHQYSYGIVLNIVDNS